MKLRMVTIYCTQHHTRKLETIQRCAAHFIMSDNCLTSSMSAITQLAIRSAEDLQLIMFFKIVTPYLIILHQPLESLAETASYPKKVSAVKKVRPRKCKLLNDLKV